MPGLRAVATGRYVASGWTSSPYSMGGYTNLKPGQVSAFAALRWIDSDDPAMRQEVRAGALVFAGEHLSDDYCGYMNGAAQTGRLAADSVLRSVAVGEARRRRADRQLRSESCQQPRQPRASAVPAPSGLLA